MKWSNYLQIFKEWARFVTSSSVVAVLTESMLWHSASSMFLWCGEADRGEGCCGGTSAPWVAPAAVCAPAPPGPTGLCAAWRFCRFCSDWWARFSWCCCTMCCCTASWCMGWMAGGAAEYGGERRWRFACAVWSASCSLFTGRGLWPRLSTAEAGRAGRVAGLRRALTEVHSGSEESNATRVRASRLAPHYWSHSFLYSTCKAILERRQRLRNKYLITNIFLYWL